MTHEKLETAGRACASRFALHKILLRSAVSSFRSLKVFEDCSGGNSRPSRPSGVGGGTFLLTNVCLFPLARDHALARLAPERNAQRTTHNVQRPMLKSANSGRVTWPTALTLVALIVA